MRDAVTVEFTQADLGEGKARAVLVHDNVCLGTEFGHQVGGIAVKNCKAFADFTITSRISNTNEMDRIWIVS